MFKPELMKEISARCDVDEKTVRKVYDTMVKVIKETLLFGIEIKLQGFANFTLVTLKEKVMNNPQTQEKMTIPKRYKVKIDLPRKFKEQIAKKEVY